MAEAESESRETEGQPAADLGTADDAGAAPKDGTMPVPATGTPPLVEEIGGPKGAEPTRYGDWERKGRCIDF
jgi:hypothetical protein